MKLLRAIGYVLIVLGFVVIGALGGCTIGGALYRFSFSTESISLSVTLGLAGGMVGLIVGMYFPVRVAEDADDAERARRLATEAPVEPNFEDPAEPPD